MDITSNAIEQVKKMLSSADNTSSGIHISVIPGCCSPKPVMTVKESKDDNEKVVTVDGIPFFIEPSTEKILSGYIVDFNSNGFKLDYMLSQGRCCR